MAKRSNKQSPSSSLQPRTIRWRAIASDPVVHSVLALVIVTVGLITLLALFRVTRGRWADAWVGWLQLWLGWGVLPVALAIVAAGLLWLAHQLDRPIKWRWRPFIGVELALFSLLMLTHTIAGRGDPWGLVGAGWGGGLVGWGLYMVFAELLGLGALVTGVLALAMFVLGMGLVFDVTWADVKQAAAAIWGALKGWRLEHRPAELPRRHPSRPVVAPPIRPQPVSPPKPPPPRESPPSPRGQPGAETVPGGVSSARPVVPPRVSPATAVSVPPREYVLPPLDLLNEPEGPVLSDEEIRRKSSIIEETLAQFGLPVEVAEVRVGPTVTQFGVRPGFVERSGVGGQRRQHKVRVSQISTLADDLALALAAPRLRIEAPVPGRSIVGIEVPNNRVQLVGVREVMESEEFAKLGSPLALALGRDVAGDPVVADLAKMPHLLIAGTTGSGKSVCIKAIIMCLIFYNTPNELRMIMIDPKMVELARFNGLPHLYGNVEVDLERVVKVLRWVAVEMDERYKRFAAAAARSLEDYNRLMKQKGEATLPRIVVLVDELADLMMLAPDEVERTICRIAQMARATGIHLVVATQRPSVDVVTGLIKANFPARISFATASQIDSRVILDMPGAETLMGRGDMLYLAADAGYPVRVQGCFASEEEIERVVAFWRKQAGPSEEEAPWERMIQSGGGLEETPIGGEGDDDGLLEQAIALVRSTGSASASLLQRRLRIGHPRAARLMQQMEEMGIIGPPEAAGRTRRVIIGDED